MDPTHQATRVDTSRYLTDWVQQLANQLDAHHLDLYAQTLRATLHQSTSTQRLRHLHLEITRLLAKAQVLEVLSPTSHELALQLAAHSAVPARDPLHAVQPLYTALRGLMDALTLEVDPTWAAKVSEALDNPDYVPAVRLERLSIMVLALSHTDTLPEHIQRMAASVASRLTGPYEIAARCEVARYALTRIGITPEPEPVTERPTIDFVFEEPDNPWYGEEEGAS